MILFADTDFILKFCAFDLMHDVLAVLGIQHQDVRVLGTSKYNIRTKEKKSKRFSRTYGEEGVARTLAFMAGAREAEVLEAEYDRLISIVGIDPGEAILVSATATPPSFLLGTGDKRFMKAVASTVGLDDIRERLKRRVVCVEKAFMLLIERDGFTSCCDRVARGTPTPTGGSMVKDSVR